MEFKLESNAVKYLALEGGGGKGFAFLGAIKALEKLGVIKYERGKIKNLEGVSGASAGAITALLLSCGFSSLDIENELKNNDFSKYFTIPKQGRNPGIYGLRSKQISMLTQGTCSESIKEPQNERIPWLIEQILKLIDFNEELNINNLDLLFKSLGFLGPSIAEYYINEPPFNLLVSDPANILTNLKSDLGIFDGIEFIYYFQDVIMRGAKKLGIKNPDPRMNFMKHRQIFNTKLGIMGTNLETMKSVFFSALTTPLFPVAAAVRISMSLPLLFKPIVLNQTRNDEIYKISKRESKAPIMNLDDMDGVWVDGGLLNNIPIRIMDEWDFIENRNPSKYAFKTLGLRLELEKRKEIVSIMDLLTVYPLMLGFFGTGESHINRSLLTNFRSIVLDTEGLDLLNFKPPEEEVAKVIQKKSWDSVYNYFFPDKEPPIIE